jgi:hypothetical protein
MSEPLRAWRDENEEPRPRPYLIPAKKPAGDNDHADRGTRTDGWFYRTASRPTPEQLSRRDRTHPLSLTWEQIDYFIARERIFDLMLDEQYWHDTVLFDQAIDDRYWRNGKLCDRPMDAEPEIDDPEIG